MWLETDPDAPDLAASPREEFSPASFVAYALEVPMLFAQAMAATGRSGGDEVADFSGASARVEPVFGDWADHLTPSSPTRALNSTSNSAAPIAQSGDDTRPAGAV